MSIRIMTAVWEVGLADSEKLILLALADWSDDDGNCWPSIAQLAAKTSKSERTVQSSIHSLASAGHLTRTEVVGRGCKYRVHPRKDCTPAAAAPRSKRTPAVSAPPQGTTQTPAAAAPNTSIHTNTSQEAAPPSRTGAKPKFVLPGHLPAELWDDFVDMRKRLGKPMTAKAMSLAVTRLDKLSDDGWPPGDVLSNSILNSYQGLFPPKDDRRNEQHQPSPSLRGARPDPALDLMRMGQARLAAQRGDPDPDRGAWPALPAGGRG